MSSDGTPAAGQSEYQAVAPAEMFCLRCNTRLVEYGESECPKCRLQYDSQNAATYRRWPMFLLWKFWLPGMAASIVSGLISYAICLQGGDMGVALFFAVPVSFGAILGYATHVRYWLLALLGIAVTGSVVLTLVAMDVSGFFCGMMLSLIFLLPVFAGMFVGLVVRYVLKATRWDQKWYLPLLLFAAFPYAAQWLESSFPRREEIATVRTDLHVHATPQEAWDAVMFYEEVTHSPPWLLHLALPKPVSSEGNKQQVGDVVRCRYDRGYLVKRISRLEPGRAMEFEVLEQHLHFERDVTLQGGSFLVQPLPDGTARVVLTTRYKRHLRPRWLWQSTEQTVVHTLHGHVLEGMRRKAMRIDQQQKDGDRDEKDENYDRDSPRRKKHVRRNRTMPNAAKFAVQ